MINIDPCGYPHDFYEPTYHTELNPDKDATNFSDDMRYVYHVKLMQSEW
ncbi:MAG: hypothetical protein AB7V56_13445 [Candidatus Nitrosocosmicus sp.]|nr:hypothetical protein [Candidatus Nitrosocosmicus sp. SS]MDR4490283.1 hypothetical protein [Candidatus Nitrosocosmicus sp.]HET6590035.1 hypothetical protein [Candidatus Nitrosocosmicus sp.]